ncbi:MAG TPA: DUF6600 domain-containing protein, partial [Spirochaetia bacterium]|nr:DUF6600 domain-containing protein [Spirochaetia bacterium]
MTRHVNRVALLVAALAALTAAAAGADPPGVVARLNFTQGPVSFRPGSLEDWAPAELNYPLTVGDHVWTDDGGRAEMHVGSSAVRLDAGTEVSFLNLDDQAVQVSLAQGTINVRLRQLDVGDTFEVDTPNSVVTLVQPGSYTITATGDDNTGLTVRGGQAEVTAAGNDFDVPMGQTATVVGSGSVGWYLQPSGPYSDFGQWWSARDAREDQLASANYVSRDMTGYDDLDANGTWTVMPGYGPVWSPTTVPVGWAPYKYGRWAWVAPWGWTWIDEAPWGFAPFHYGRWAFAAGRWVWVPGTRAPRPVYAPALVAFVGTGPGADPNEAGVGWFPLGPQEVYVPPYQASPTYVQRVNVTQVNNVTITTIEQTNVTQVTYVNRTAPYAVTVVPRETFMGGRPAQSSAISFTTNQARTAPVIGMGPTVAPQRESVIGQRFESAPPARQPPPQVMNRPVYGRLTPAPAPPPFMVQQAPLAPVTIYRQPPAQVVAPPAPPVRQQRPMIINPRQPQPGYPQPGYPQPRQGFQPQPQPMQPQPGFQPQPQP